MGETSNYFRQESERLTFRKLTEEDIPSWVEFFINNESLPFLGIDLTLEKEELSREWILAQFVRYKKQGLGHLAVELKESNEFIGMCGIIPRELAGKIEHEIAYSIKPKHWKKGYGTEMAQQMKKYGQEHINAERFISIIDNRNIDSIKVALKNSMELLFETTYLGMNVNIYGIEKQ